MGEQPTSTGGFDTPDWDELEHHLTESAGPPSRDEPQSPASRAKDHPFTDTRPLSRWLVGALLVGMVIRGVALGIFWVMRGWFNGEARPIEDAHETIAILTGGTAIATLLVSAVTAILWVVWLWYSYSNLPALGRRPSYKRFWAWLAWLVPIWSLFRPKQLHNEVWRSGGDDDSEPLWIQLWWLMFLAGLVSLNLVSSTEFTWADVVANGLWILISIPAIAVVWVSSTRQWNQRHAERGTPPRTVGRLARYAPTGVGLFSLGLAALVILMPHSEDLPGGTRVAGVLDIEPGECFTGSETEGLGLIWIVDCSTPHTAESVGVVDIDAATYPGLDTLADFGTIGCWGAFYEYAGDRAESLDYSLDWYSPLAGSWTEGYSSIVCTVSHVEGTEMSNSVADPESRWIAFEHMRAGRCYEFHWSLLAAAELPCSGGVQKVGDLKRYRNDPLLEFPGEGFLHDDLSCSDGVSPEPLVPNSETWSLGDRVSVCLEEEPISA